jgi:hypothetical protein
LNYFDLLSFCFDLCNLVGEGTLEIEALTNSVTFTHACCIITPVEWPNAGVRVCGLRAGVLYFFFFGFGVRVETQSAEMAPRPIV